MKTKYYLPISSTSLAHYFGCASIKPSKYFDNKPEDLQDKYKDFLLITTHLGTQQTDCCLELVFTDQEVKDLIDVKNDFYLYEKPLPITRVKKVYFSNKKTKEQTITNIDMSTAFVPNEFIEIKEFENIQATELDMPQDIHIEPYNEPLRRFNGFLGGFALMRLAGEEYMNYSENYFATLSFFNNAIRDELASEGKNIDSRYSGAFTGEGGFQRIFPLLHKVIDEKDIENIAKEEKQTIKKDRITRIIDLNNLDKNAYIVAVLNMFGVEGESKKKRIDELILSNFKSEIKPGKSEGIALCYGINRGYSAFTNKYILGESEKTVKFQLNSQLDYYTIESLYQYAFNGISSERFSYLDDWCPKQKWSKISKKTDYKILDVIVVGKEKAKVSSFEYLENLLLHFFQKDKVSLFRDLLGKVREIIYNDAKDEITNDYEGQILQKQEEIEKLKNEIQQLKNKSISIKPYQYEQEDVSVAADSQVSYSTKKDIEQPTKKHEGNIKKVPEDKVKKKSKSVKKKKAEEKIPFPNEVA